MIPKGIRFSLDTSSIELLKILCHVSFNSSVWVRFNFSLFFIY